jgi:ABC-type nitrate/sulfonate/bicarbonate transport system permease component
MVWLGFSIVPKIVVVVLVCIFPIAVSFAEGLMKADPELDDLLIIMGASKAKRLILSGLPQAMPGLFSGLRITAAYSVMGAVLAEWVGAKEGLGIIMTRYMASFRTAELFADIIIVILMSLSLFKIVVKAEKKIIYWRKDNEEF